jgi:hypothetical protein
VTVAIDTLSPGARFAIPGLGKQGTLVSVGPGSATVEYDAQRTREFTDRWGERVTIAQHKERAAISRATEVEQLTD